MKKMLFALLSLLFLQFAADAQTWQKTAGMYFGNTVRTHVTAAGTLLATPPWGNWLYRSTDLGASWEVTAQGLAPVYGEMFNDANRNVYLLTGPSQTDQYYSSTDDGRTWSPVSTVPTHYIRGIPTEGYRQDALPNGQLVRMADFGTKVQVYIPQNNTWQTIAKIPYKGNWGISVLAASPNYDLFALGRKGDVIVLRHLDAGWAKPKVVLAIPANPASWVSFSPDGRTVAIGTEGNGVGEGGAGLYCSTNAGATWIHRNIAGGSASYFGQVGAAVYAQTDNGFYKSTDDGMSWSMTPLNTFAGYRYSPVSALIGMRKGLLLATLQEKLATTTNDGKKLSRLKNSFTALSPYVEELTPGLNGKILAATDRGIYCSGNDGTSWINLASFRAEALTQTADGIIYAARGDSGLVCNIPNDAKWVSINTGLTDIHARWIAATTDGILLASTADGLYRSTDKGAHWVSTGPARSDYQKILVNANGQIFVNAGGRDDADPGGVYTSTDKGLTWNTINSGLPSLNVGTIGLTPKGELLAGMVWGGVYRSSGLASPSAGQRAARAENDAPRQFMLRGNYPNPFNPATTIMFDLAKASIVSVKIYNMAGQLVASPAIGRQFSEGTNEMSFNGDNLASGIYFYSLEARDPDGGTLLFSATQKMMLLK